MYAFLTGWLGYASGSLFFKASTSSVDFNLIKADDLNVEKVVVSSNETTLSRPGKKFLLTLNKLRGGGIKTQHV